jgi:hypothetical protein
LLENATETLHNLIEVIIADKINMLHNYLISKNLYTRDGTFVLGVISQIA